MSLEREYLRRLASSSVAYVAMDERTSRPAVVVPLSETFGFSRFQIYRIISSLVRAGLDIERVRSTRTILIIYLDGNADIVFPDRLATKLRRRAYVAAYTVDQHIAWLLDGTRPETDAEATEHIVNKINDVLMRGAESREIWVDGVLVWPCDEISGIVGDFVRSFLVSGDTNSETANPSYLRASRSLLVNNKIIKAFYADYRFSDNRRSKDNVLSKSFSREKIESPLSLLLVLGRIRQRSQTDRLVEYQEGARDTGENENHTIRSAMPDMVDELRRLSALPMPSGGVDDKKAYLRHPFVQVWAAAFRMKPWHLRQPWRDILAVMPTDRKSVRRWTQAIDHLRAAHGLQNPWRIGLMLEVYTGACPVCNAIEKRKQFEQNQRMGVR